VQGAMFHPLASYLEMKKGGVVACSPCECWGTASLPAKVEMRMFLGLVMF
jgi:hypothetical protein